MQKEESEPYEKARGVFQWDMHEGCISDSYFCPKQLASGQLYLCDLSITRIGAKELAIPIILYKPFMKYIHMQKLKVAVVEASVLQWSKKTRGWLHK